MSTTPNQITDVFQESIGRAPTPFEIQKYSTASIQDLANLKNTYSSYKPDQSVVDYLAYQGQDNSIQARSELANKYGIQGYTGSYQQNVDLLNKLKGGQPTTTTPAVVGTISGATPTPPNYDTTTDKLTDAGKAQGLPETPALTGTVSGATTTTSPTTPETTLPPEVQSAKDTYTTAQQSVLDVQKQIDDINSTLDRTLQDKRDEIARSGGIVNESQLRSTVLAENAPLLQERQDLLTQRTQLVGEQNIAGKNYTDLLNQSYKNEQLEQGQEKITDAETTQAQKFANSMALKWSDAGINATDDNATILDKLQKSPMYLATLGAKVKSGQILPKLLITTDSSGNQSVIAVNPKTGTILGSNSTGGIAPATLPSTTVTQVPLSLMNPESWFGETTTKSTTKGGASPSSDSDPLNLNQ